MLAEDAAPLRLWRSGSTQTELERAGYSTAQLRELIAKDRNDIRKFLQVGYSFDELKQAGYTSRQILDAGCLGTEITAAEQALRELAEDGGVNHRVRTAANTQLELMRRGFSYVQLQQSASTLANLLDAGYTVHDLIQAGQCGTWENAANPSCVDLMAAGYTPTDIADRVLVWQQLEADGVGMDLSQWANSSLLLHEELYRRRQSAEVP